MPGHRQVFESIIIVSVGMTMHLNCISIMELHHSNLQLIKPNVASSIFVFSILCILSKVRMMRVSEFHYHQKTLVYLLEIALIQYVTEFLLRQVWFSCVRLLNFMCRFMSLYVLVANEHYLENTAASFSSWIRNEAFELGRLLLAFGFFLLMIDITGAKGLLLFFWDQRRHLRVFNRTLPPINEENENEFETDFDDEE